MQVPCPVFAIPWWQWHPPVGVFIAVLAFLGVVVPLFREWGKIGPREKALWTAAMFALLLLELRTIYLDRAEHDREQTHAACEQLHSFSEIAGPLADALKGIKRTLDTANETLKQTNQTLIQTQPHALFGPPRFDVGNATLAAGVKILYNVYYKNNGSDTAKNLRIYSNMYMGKPDDAMEEDRIVALFEEDWKKLGERRKGKASLVPGAEQFSSSLSNPFTQGDIDNLQSAKETIYTITRISYSDKTGEWYSDYCEDVQLPIVPNSPPIQHPCVGHINNRYRPKQP